MNFDTHRFTALLYDFPWGFFHCDFSCKGFWEGVTYLGWHRADHNWLVVSDSFYFPFHMGYIILPNWLTFIIFQHGFLTTNQINHATINGRWSWALVMMLTSQKSLRPRSWRSWSWRQVGPERPDPPPWHHDLAKGNDRNIIMILTIFMIDDWHILTFYFFGAFSDKPKP